MLVGNANYRCACNVRFVASDDEQQALPENFGLIVGLTVGLGLPLLIFILILIILVVVCHRRNKKLKEERAFVGYDNNVATVHQLDQDNGQYTALASAGAESKISNTDQVNAATAPTEPEKLRC